METIHVSDVEAARDLPSLLAKVRAGAHVIIEHDRKAIATIDPPFQERTIEESLALAPENSTAVMDEDFARDIAAAIEWHREPSNPPAWD